MQIEPESVDWLFHGGAFGLICSIAAFAFRVMRKVEKRLDRDEHLKADYPPHRHINGSIVYPDEYQPAHVDRLVT